MVAYLRSLRPLFNVKPWSSVLIKCQQEIRNSCTLPLRKICSDSSIENAKIKPVSEEAMDVARKSNNLSRHLIKSDINLHGKVDVGTISCFSEGTNNSSNFKGNSRSSVNSESCSISTSVLEERNRGTADSKVRPSVALGVPNYLVRSKSSSISSFNIALGSKDVINAQTCSISTPIGKEDPKSLLSFSVKADNRFGERKLKIPILQKREIVSKTKTNEKRSAKVSDGEFMERKVRIPKTFEREKAFEEQEKTDVRSAVGNRDLENVEAKLENKDLEIIELNFVKNSRATTSLRPIIEFDTCNNTITVPGYGSQSRRCSSDKELLYQNEMNKDSDSQKKFDTRIAFLDRESDSDTSSVSGNINGRSHYSQDSENLKVVRNQSSPQDLPTLNDLSPLCEPTNHYCDEKELVINFQIVGATGLANVKCPEECPMCYTVLCPSRFYVNLKTFHLTLRCLGCDLFITITLGDYEKPSNMKRIYKRPGPKSKTNPLASKKQKISARNRNEQVKPVNSF